MPGAVLITGAAKRIGSQIARQLAKSGYDIMIHYRSSEKAALNLATELQEEFDIHADCVQGDLNDPGSASEIVNAGFRRFPHLNVLVNNASIYETISFEETELDDLQRNFNIHLFSPITMTRAFKAGVRTEGEANVIFILDTKISEQHTEHFPYILSKKSAGDLTKLLAKELAPDIRVNGICPGPILPPKGADENYLAERAKETALKRYGDPADIAGAVDSVLKQSYLTGNILYLDGGEHLL